jgi:predicted phage tail protein
MPDKKLMEREYGEMIYSLLSEMSGTMLATLRQVNNSLANLQRIVLQLENTINTLVSSNKEVRDQRYQEEIGALEAQMENLRKQLEEKKLAKNTMTTSEQIEKVISEQLTNREQAEKKRKAIDWIAVRNQLINVILGAIVLAIVLYSLPSIGQFLVNVFTKK